MDKLTKISILSAIAAIIVIAWLLFPSRANHDNYPDTMKNSNGKSNGFKLSSPDFLDNELIPSKYTCDGEDINPPLSISNTPRGTKSLTLIMDDPDAMKPAGRVWDHWIVWNIPPTVTEIKEGKNPEGVFGKGTSGNLKYHGPCPPDTEHRYFFKLYALDTLLPLNEGATKPEVEQAMAGHILGQAVLTGRYERKR